MSGSPPAAEKPVTCRLHCRKMHISAGLAALSEVFAGLDRPSILGGNKAKKDADGFSYWAANPAEVFEFRHGQTNPFERLDAVLNKYKLEDDSKSLLPKNMFCGGCIGYFSYEFGRYIEKLPATAIDDLQIPVVRLCFYDKLISYDHAADNFWLMAIELPGDSQSPQDKLSELERLLVSASEMAEPGCRRGDLDNIDFSTIRCNIDRDYYRRAVEKITRYIYDGDVYQINFSQRFECDFNAPAMDLFHWQNRYNPSGYSAYIDDGSSQIVSASPEMFITIHDRVISTKPIKGTRRRMDEGGPAPEQARQTNDANFNELARSTKEQAELNMIVDLERNDLARICKAGTRKVVQPRTIESYPTVFHAVATVAGELRDDVSLCDVLKGTFPGGSITGAPKIRSMEIIDETEPTARGVYTGSIGYIGLDGRACLNIAIRTIIVKDQKAYAQTGGGIVADSDPEAEWHETITKARALLAGIDAVCSKTETDGSLRIQTVSPPRNRSLSQDVEPKR
jgi:para-aminobenzoate synthetase component 1